MGLQGWTRHIKDRKDKMMVLCVCVFVLTHKSPGKRTKTITSLDRTTTTDWVNTAAVAVAMTRIVTL